MLRKYTLLITLTLLFLSGCTNAAELVPTPTTLSRPTAIAQPTATRTWPPTMEPITTDSTTIPSQPPSTTPTIELTIPTCKNIEIPAASQAQLEIQGGILYRTYDGNDRQVFNLIGGTPPTFLPLSMLNDRDHIIASGFSPDGKKLSYFSTWKDEDFVGYLDSEGNLIEQQINFEPIQDQIYRDDPDAEIIGVLVGSWINDQLAYVMVPWSAAGIRSFIFPTILDVTSGQWRDELITSLPDATRGSGIFDTLGISYSPDLTRAIYISYENNALVIADTSSRKIIWENAALFLPVYSIQWSPDSHFFGYYASTPLYIIDRSGNGIAHIQPPDIFKDPQISNIQWSPNGEMLALSIYDKEVVSHEQILYIYDINSKKYIFQCPLYKEESVPAFFWSPDHRYIVSSGTSIGPIMLIDLENGSVVRLVDNAAVMGWSEEFSSMP